MNKRAVLWMAAASAASALALAGCGGGTGGGAYGGAPASSPSSSSAPAASSSGSSGSDAMGYGAGGSSGSASASTGETLKTATIGGQKIVVDGDGKVVYYYTRDNAGTTVSACTGGCASLWPAVVSSDAAKLEGVTAKVGSIKAADGKSQVTLNGMPIYYYAKDTAPGQANGQGVAGVWYVIGADGTMITAALK